MQVIGFGGLARAGKGTAADELCRFAIENGFTPTKMSFAGPLKASAHIIGAQKDTPTDALYRKFCQMVGSHMRDPNFVPNITGPDYWVRLAEMGVRMFAQKEAVEMNATPAVPGDVFHERVIIFDDLRYDNEIDMLRRNGGLAVFVDAGRRLTDLDAEWRKHESEKLGLDYTFSRIPDSTFDQIISSNHSEADLRKVVRAMGPRWLGLVAEGG